MCYHKLYIFDCGHSLFHHVCVLPAPPRPPRVPQTPRTPKTPKSPRSIASPISVMSPVKISTPPQTPRNQPYSEKCDPQAHPFLSRKIDKLCLVCARTRDELLKKMGTSEIKFEEWKWRVMYGNPEAEAGAWRHWGKPRVDVKAKWEERQRVEAARARETSSVGNVTAERETGRSMERTPERTMTDGGERISLGEMHAALGARVESAYR
ncbi:hypothetical protein M501DRAFT_987531 [Patellaria atrata CBS 101060]|uniref:Uncharacterized protein n=1 Tax=Patellaria atrata CBS 101060 TaxID=1346257 RepID=A0A9P4VQB5_9PEZI|nr:hypothetical protein M501DRAFT_987531 [Patellaria atrata CBS 101060]